MDEDEEKEVIKEANKIFDVEKNLSIDIFSDRVEQNKTLI